MTCGKGSHWLSESPVTFRYLIMRNSSLCLVYGVVCGVCLVYVWCVCLCGVVCGVCVVYVCVWCAVCVCVCVCVCVRACVHACVRACVPACVRACERAHLRGSPEYIIEFDFSLGHKMGAVVEGDDVGELWNGLRETKEYGGPGSFNSLFPGSQITR